MEASRIMFVIVTFVIASQIALAAQILQGATLIRAPQYDSAIVQSDRIGPSFAYSTVEGHAYQAIAPLIQSEFHPLQIRYELPLALPTAQYIYLQKPILTTNLEPIQPNVVPVSETSKPNKETEVETIDDDTVTIDSA